MIKLVIFDAGGILYKVPTDEMVGKIVRNFLAKHGIKNIEENLEKSEKIWIKVSKLAKVGKISWKEAQEKWLESLGLNKKLVEDWIEIDKKEIWSKLIKRVSYVNETLKILKKDYKLTILSDSMANKEEFIQKLEILKIDYKLFDEIFTSHDIGYEKPHREAYLTVLRHFNVEPEETVFVGHDEDEIEGAKKVGLITIALHDKNARGDYFANQFKDLPKIISNLIT